MGDRWFWIKLGHDETLRCDSCFKYLHYQKVYLYLEADNKLGEVMCEACRKGDQEEEKEPEEESE